MDVATVFEGVPSVVLKAIERIPLFSVAISNSVSPVWLTRTIGVGTLKSPSATGSIVQIRFSGLQVPPANRSFVVSYDLLNTT